LDFDIGEFSLMSQERQGCALGGDVRRPPMGRRGALERTRAL
jgi:hypothetical protein